MKTKLILILAMILGSLLMQSCYCELWDYGPVCRIDVPPPPPPPHHHHHHHHHHYGW